MLFLIALAVEPTAAALMARSGDVTALPRCAAVAQPGEVTVCGARRADRYRVPFVVHDAGDPRYETVSAERTRLLHRTTPLQDLSPFLVGGGMAGAHATVSGDGRVITAGLRRLAP